jgi:pSer/pThr/pTyr-binding forkhead associated (FHA) protein
MEKPIFSIGRTQEADLPMVAGGVSRVHLSVQIRDKQVFLTDQGSANGTFVNGERLEPQAAKAVKPNDLVKVGTLGDAFYFEAIPQPFELLGKAAQKLSLSASMEELASEIQQRSKEEGAREIRRAQMEAEQIIAAAQKTSEIKRTESLLELEARKGSLEKELQQMRSQFQTQAAELKMAAQKQADEMISDAQKRIQADFNAADAQIEEHLKSKQQRAFSIFSEAQEKAESILSEARHEAARLNKEAAEQARDIQQQAIQRTSLKTAALQDNFEKEMKEIRETKLKQIRIEADVEKQKILLEARQVEEGIAELRAQSEQLHAENKKLEPEVAKSRAIALLIEEQNKRSVQVQKEYDALVRKRGSLAASIESDIKELEERLVLEHQERKKELSEELTRSRLNALYDLQARVEAEEKKYEESRRMRAIELAETIQKKIFARADLWQSGKLQNGVVRECVQQAVRECLFDEKSTIEAPAIGIDARSENFEKKRKLRRRTLALSGIGLLVFAFVYQASIFSFLKAHQGESETAAIIENRHVRSLFRPEQNLEFHDNYVDNVLYMKGYYETKTNSDYIETWTLRLNDLNLLKKMKLSEEAAVQFVAKETNLVQRLGILRTSLDAVYLDEGISRMHKAEAEDSLEIKKILKNDENYQAIRALELDSIKEFQRRHPGRE